MPRPVPEDASLEGEEDMPADRESKGTLWLDPGRFAPKVKEGLDGIEMGTDEAD